MQNDKQPLVLREDDHTLLLTYLRSPGSRSAFNAQEAEKLYAELKRAEVVSADHFPADAVRVGSRVKVREGGKVMELTLVLPERANIRERKVSVMAPIGAALIGFRKGQQVQWRVPAGLKTFTIEEVVNQTDTP
ncbi:MAG TPA: GreA/GreB family elongation factor [Candidatus Sulfotelmatobacter sp.]|nr:GreA/GreB family elongation factor [Candidatus Sulfotelmatobacter sp.]